MSAERPQHGSIGRQKWVMPMLALLFVGPLAAAASFYFFGEGWRPAASVNYGKLLDPPVTLAEVELPTASGNTTHAGFLRGRWSLVYISDSDCDADCREALDKTRRVRLALREKAVRVQRVLMVRENPPGADFLAEDRSDVLAVSLTGSDGAALFGQFANSVAAAPGATGRVYLVDPLGNAMMLYEPGFEMKGMLADLKRLLKLSRIG